MYSLDVDAVPPTADDKASVQNEYLSKMPVNKLRNETDEYLLLKDEFYDAAVLYCEDDFKEATELIKILKSSIVFQNDDVPKIELFDVILPTGEMFSQMEILLKKCSCIIIYLTLAFLSDSSLIYQANELLINFVKKQGMNSRYCQLMVLTNTPEELPIGWKSLCRTKWYTNRDLALKKLKKMLYDAHKVRVRKELEMNHFLEAMPKRILPMPNYTIESTSPEIVGNPTNYHIYNAGVNYNYHVNATNVQIGENARMYGANLVDSETKEDPVAPKLQSVSSNPFPVSTSPLPHVTVPSEAEKKVSLGEFPRMSELGDHLPSLLPISTQPDSSTGFFKDGSNTKDIKDIVSQQEIPIQKDSAAS